MSELPTAWITYQHDGMTFMYEGEYHVSNLTFEPEESHGIRFDFDGEEYIICGNLAGHVIYRRVNGDSSCYSMTWTEFSEHVADGMITVLGEIYE